MSPRADAARAADEVLLVRRLRGLGLSSARRIVVHENRSVLVSEGRRGVRVHRGYAYAPDRVLAAVLTFIRPAAAPAERRRAERTLRQFPLEHYVPSLREPRPALGIHPRDRPLIERLRRLHATLNQRHFDGALGRIRFRLSARMRTSLGELLLDHRGERALEIAVSRRHTERDPWDEVVHTVLHEMVHQWQVEAGLGADHGPTFRRKAVEVGVDPHARRKVHRRRAPDERS